MSIFTLSTQGHIETAADSPCICYILAIFALASSFRRVLFLYMNEDRIGSNVAFFRSKRNKIKEVAYLRGVNRLYL